MIRFFTQGTCLGILGLALGTSTVACTSLGKGSKSSEETAEKLPPETKQPFPTSEDLQVLPNLPTGYLAFSWEHEVTTSFGDAPMIWEVEHQTSKKVYAVRVSPIELKPICQKNVCPVIVGLPVGEYKLKRSYFKSPVLKSEKIRSESKQQVKSQPVATSVEKYLPSFSLKEDTVLHLGYVLAKFNAQVHEDGSYRFDARSMVRPMEPTKTVWKTLWEGVVQLQGSFLLKGKAGAWEVKSFRWSTLPKSLPSGVAQGWTEE